MKAIEQAKAHFSTLEIRVVEVPEWGGDDGPLRIYVTPLTLAEKARLFRMAKGNDLAVLAYALIIKARDAEGVALFTIEDKRALMHETDSVVLGRVAAEVMGVEDEDTMAGN